METPSLDALALEHGTEKSSKGHGYCDTYERYLSSIREQPIKLLEIGIATGASHRMWSDWMPNASVYGIDTVGNRQPGGRIQYFTGHQADEKQMLGILDQIGPLDVIIDDGGHVASDVLACLNVAWPYLKPGGLYVIEDLHVGPDDRARQKTGSQPLKLGTSSITVIEHLRSLPNPHPTLGMIDIYDENICFIRKPS